MLALACIGVFVKIEMMTNFISFIDNRGHLVQVFESLLKSNEKLCRTLSNIPEKKKCLYVYESKMSMLLRLENTYKGAEVLSEICILV